MSLITPDIGLLFWMVLSFSIVLFILSKFAWPKILGAVKDREEFIENALLAAEKAKEEMSSMNADNEKLLRDARDERDALMKEAREIKDKIVADAKGIAQEEADKILVIARESINTEKLAAITELKNQVATLSIDIAEKILKHELSSEEKQKTILKELLEDVNMN